MTDVTNMDRNDQREMQGQEASHVSQPDPATAHPAAPSGDYVPSNSDSRVANNVMRHQYRVLSDDEKAQMQALKDMGLGFLQKLHEIGKSDPAGDRLGSRELALAGTKIEEAVMWAVKHLTK